MRKLRKIVTIVMVICLAMTIFGCQSAPEQATEEATASEAAGETASGEDTIKIGCIYALSGTNAQAGKEYIEAIKLAADIINGEYDLDMPFAKEIGLPNLGGRKIELVIADHQGSPEVGMAETERLITNEDVVAIVGAQMSAVCKTSSNVAERLGIPYLTPECTSSELTERGLKWFFRITPVDTTFVNDTYKFLDEMNATKDAGIKTVAIVSEDTEYGALLAHEEEALAAEYGYEVVEKIIFPANSTNVTSEVLKLVKAQPDAILMAVYASDGILFMNTMKEQNYLPKMIIGQRGGFTMAEFLGNLEDKADYLYTTNVWALDLADSNELIAKVNDMYKERSGVNLTGDYSRAFTGLMTIADAINRAGSTDPEAIRTALIETEITNEGQMIVPWDGIKFDEKGQNEWASGIVTQAKDGIYHTVYPASGAAMDPVVPMPGWDER